MHFDFEPVHVYFYIDLVMSSLSNKGKPFIYLHVCSIVFSMVRSRAHLQLILTAQQTAHFRREGEAPTNATECSIAHTL